MLTTFQADEHVVAALRAGASGFLVKDTPPAEIINAVRLVAAGDAIISPSVTRTLLSHFGNTEASDGTAAARRLSALTDREREVANAVGAGASNAEIAASLFLSEATVKAYVSRLLASSMRPIGFRSRSSCTVPPRRDALTSVGGSGDARHGPPCARWKLRYPAPTLRVPDSAARVWTT